MQGCRRKTGVFRAKGGKFNISRVGAARRIEKFLKKRGGLP